MRSNVIERGSRCKAGKWRSSVRWRGHYLSGTSAAWVDLSWLHGYDQKFWVISENRVSSPYTCLWRTATQAGRWAVVLELRFLPLEMGRKSLFFCPSHLLLQETESSMQLALGNALIPPGWPFDSAFTKVALGVHFKPHLQKDVKMIRRVPRWAPTSFVGVLFTYKCATTDLKLSGSRQPYSAHRSCGSETQTGNSLGGGGCLCSVKSGVQREDSRTGGGWQLETRIIWRFHPSQAWWLLLDCWLRPYLLGLLAGTSTHAFSSWSGQSLHTVAGCKAEQPKIPGGSSPAFVSPPFEVDNTVVFLQGSIHWDNCKGFLSFRPRGINFASWRQGNERTFGIQNTDVAFIFLSSLRFSLKCLFPTVQKLSLM